VTLPVAILLAALLAGIGFGIGFRAGRRIGLRPLKQLDRALRRRSASDVSPIPAQGMAADAEPLIAACNDLLARLERSQHAQQHFIGNAAHQLRTPLTGLKMQAELALSESDPENMRILLQQIAESTDRAAHLINQLLSLARAEASCRQTHAVEVVDLESLARNITREWMPSAVARQIDLGFEGAGWPLYIDGNPLLLSEMLNNLIDNAIKYTPRGGHVTVRARAGERAIVEVEDNGPGIPDKERGLVFERFYRVLGNEAPGSGLGLAIVREIAQLHRADVRLQHSANETGTVAQAVFPRHAAPASLPAET
jgi:two-component system sensor histidine kinase TctE